MKPVTANLVWSTCSPDPWIKTNILDLVNMPSHYYSHARTESEQRKKQDLGKQQTTLWSLFACKPSNLSALIKMLFQLENVCQQKTCMLLHCSVTSPELVSLILFLGSVSACGWNCSSVFASVCFPKFALDLTCHICTCLCLILVLCIVILWLALLLFLLMSLSTNLTLCRFRIVLFCF